MPSSVIRFYRYDPARQELLVVFQSGLKYSYSDVPAEIHDGLNAAFSKGEFFNQHIRDRYAFRRL
jgi:lysyl-tRNA synthetase class 2